MSHRAMSWAMSQVVPDPAAKVVLLTLAQAHNHLSGQCFPSIDRIVNEAHISKAGVRRKLNVLIELGLIEVHRSHDDNGRQKANNYVLVGLDCAGKERRPAAAPGYQDGTLQLELEGGGSQAETPEGLNGDTPEGLSCETPIRKREEYQEDSLAGPAAGETAAPVPFDQFWTIYPKREGDNPKKPARAKFDRLVKSGADPSQIIAAAALYAKQHPKPSRFVVQATRWLNEERFRDAAEENQPAAATREVWEKRLRHFAGRGYWDREAFGPAPGETGCRAPLDLVLSLGSTDSVMARAS